MVNGFGRYERYGPFIYFDPAELADGGDLGPQAMIAPLL
jgi:hypothetical protein